MPIGTGAKKRGPTERTWGRRCRLPTVGSNQELAGESACPTFFMKFRGPKAHPNRIRRRRGTTIHRRLTIRVGARRGRVWPRQGRGSGRRFAPAPGYRGTAGRAVARLVQLVADDPVAAALD